MNFTEIDTDPYQLRATANFDDNPDKAYLVFINIKAAAKDLVIVAFNMDDFTLRSLMSVELHSTTQLLEVNSYYIGSSTSLYIFYYEQNNINWGTVSNHFNYS